MRLQDGADCDAEIGRNVISTSGRDVTISRVIPFA